MPDERMPPHDLSAEEAVLGSILLDPGSVYLLSGILDAKDFYREKNGVIYAAAEELAKHGVGIDVVTLCSEVEKTGMMDQYGGASYITSLLNAVPTASHITHYAGIVREKAKLRRLILLSSETVRKAYATDANSMNVWADARHSLDDVLDSAESTSTLRSDVSLEWYLALQSQRHEDHENKKPQLTFPWIDIANAIPIIPRGAMILVVAKPGIGKTVFFENLAEHWAQGGFRVAFFHAELSHAVMMDRRMARHSGVPLYELMKGVNNEAVADAMQRISEWPGGVDYIHCPGWTMDRIATTARQMAMSARLDAVVVDYLQKLRLNGGEHGQNLAQLRGQDSETLKTLGEELSIVTVLGSQRSRANDKTETLTAGDMRDSNEPLEKCNIAFALGRKPLDAPMRDSMNGRIIAEAGELSPTVSVRLDKHTMGSVREYKLLLIGPRFNLVNLAQHT
jgi:replicative DNA helicase